MSARTCAWCHGVLPDAADRRVRYCCRQHRRDAGHYAERIDAWRADLVDLEADAAGWRKLHAPVPVALVVAIAGLRDLIDRRPSPPETTPVPLRRTAP